MHLRPEYGGSSPQPAFVMRLHMEGGWSQDLSVAMGPDGHLFSSSKPAPGQIQRVELVMQLPWDVGVIYPDAHVTFHVDGDWREVLIEP